MRRKPGSVVDPVTEVSQVDDNAAYMRLYRERNPEYAARNARQARARARALTRLAVKHRADYLVLYAEELESEGAV